MEPTGPQRVGQDKPGHPCFDVAVHEHVGRIHLPVAPRCNIDCNYCERKWCAHENSPGVAAELLRPADVAATLRRHLAVDPRLQIVGIAGPGEPLYNEETLATFGILAREFPALSPCLSTNGLLLPDRLDAIHALGIRHLTITINSVDGETASRLSPTALYDGRRYQGRDAGALLVEQQLTGLKRAVRLGMRVKVNCVYVPTVNGDQVKEVARAAGAAGAALFNIIPLLPRGRFSELRRPSRCEVGALRSDCEPHLPQMRHCRRCRADASGVLAEGVAARPLRIFDDECPGPGRSWRESRSSRADESTPP